MARRTLRNSTLATWQYATYGVACIPELTVAGNALRAASPSLWLVVFVSIFIQSQFTLIRRIIFMIQTIIGICKNGQNYGSKIVENCN